MESGWFIAVLETIWYKVKVMTQTKSKLTDAYFLLDILIFYLGMYENQNDTIEHKNNKKKKKR